MISELAQAKIAYANEFMEARERYSKDGKGATVDEAHSIAQLRLEHKGVRDPEIIAFEIRSRLALRTAGGDR